MIWKHDFESHTTNLYPFFSIIVPIYNAERYIERAILSVKNQTFSNWELLLINDGSTDRSLNLIEKFKEKKIRIIDKDNSGVSDTRNMGIKYSQGEWIVFLDADDFLEEDALEFFYSCLKNKEVDLLVTNFYHVYPSGQREKDRRITEHYISNINVMLDALFRQSQWHSSKWYGNLHSIWAKCFRLSIIKDNKILFKSNIKVGEDMIFVLEYILQSKNIMLMDYSTYNYQYNSLSTMNTLKWAGSEQGQLYFDIADHLVGDKVSEDAKVDLWLEIEERHWRLIHFTVKGLKQKYDKFKELFSNENYKRFSKEKSFPINSFKIRLYLFFIRHNMILSMMFLSYVREKKHKYKGK